MKPINIISKLNEAKEVKKPYGDAPQERGKERLERGKKASLPSKKIGGSLAPSKFYKLKKNNAKAADIYANDTDKVLDRVKDKNLGKGITNNKATLTRKAKLKKIVKYGDKPQPAINNKVVKESSTVDNHGNIIKDEEYKVAEKIRKLFDNSGEPWEAGDELPADAVVDACSDLGINPGSVDPTNIKKVLDGVIECNKPEKLKEDYDNGTWLKYQNQIEDALEGAKAVMGEDAFLDFCDGVSELVQSYIGESVRLECNTIEKK